MFRPRPVLFSVQTPLYAAGRAHTDSAATKPEMRHDLVLHHVNPVHTCDTTLVLQLATLFIIPSALRV